jgi:hypothetical protein
MNPRERFLATMRYQPRDRTPRGEMGFWAQTLARWRAEGMPADATTDRYFGFDYVRDRVHVSLDLLPAFREQVLESAGGYEVVRQADGAVIRRLAGSETMPQWLSYPLRSRDDWEREFLPRLDAASPARYPDDWTAQVAGWRGRSTPLGIRMGSIFGWLRNWMGLEGIALALYDDPAWVHEMMDFMAAFACGCGERALREADVDYVLLWEDMAGKNGPLISPAAFREFMLEPYKTLTGFIRDHGVDLIFVDSDGWADPLIPLWLEGGVRGFYPLERVAGMDPVAVRRKYGPALRLMGGIDKRALAAGGAVLQAEVARIAPLAAEGGYVPWCDHWVPPDVSLANYLAYRRAADAL